jgi:hypothetical protein
MRSKEAGSMPERSGRFPEFFYHAVLICLSGFFIVYEIFRAVRVSFTEDEASTLLLYLSHDLSAVFNFSAANNHLLNSVLAKIFMVGGGSSEFVLRLPNLLGFLFYLLFSFFIVNKFKNRWLAVGGFLLLNLNVYVLDFFSLCRGYGLSLDFLMACLFFYVSFLEKRFENRSSGGRDLSLAFIMAAFSVFANITMLNVYLSLLFLTFGLLAVSNQKADKQPTPNLVAPRSSWQKKALLSLLVLAAVLFNCLMIPQDPGLAKKIYQPVSVHLFGLGDRELHDTTLYRLDYENQEIQLIHEKGGQSVEDFSPYKSIKFDLPLSAMDKLTKIEFRIGTTIFEYGEWELKALKRSRSSRPKYFVFSSDPSISLVRSRLPKFRQVINWGGDRTFFHYFISRAAALIGIAALALVLIFIVGQILRRWKIVESGQFLSLAYVTFWMAAFIAYPIYILKAGGQLYFGGEDGFIQDTVFSLITGSFYKRAYFSAQTETILGLVLFSLVLFVIILYVYHRKRSLAALLPGLSVFVLLLLSSFLVVLQHLLLRTPYLTGRTALLFIPLFALFLVFLLTSVARLHPFLNKLSLAVMALLVMASLYHFGQMANWTTTQEFRNDADTKTMLHDLDRLREELSPPRDRLRLGIDREFNPVLQYYIRRMNLSWLSVESYPKASTMDFLYLKYYYMEDFIGDWLVVEKKYEISGNLLVRVAKRQAKD